MHFEVFQDITWKLFKKKKKSSFSALASLQNHHKAKSQPKLTEPIFIGATASQFFMHTTGDFDAQQGFKNQLTEWSMIP